MDEGREAVSIGYGYIGHGYRQRTMWRDVIVVRPLKTKTGEP